MDKNCTITYNYYYNCCGGETADNGNGNPVGTVISYMGTKVPKHYLACDGAVFNITDYPALSEQIKDEFGTVDYFGGDGTETFAVPDLRNEFLRGFHGAAAEQMSGDVGKHQEATSMPYVYNNNYGKGFAIGLNPSDVATGSSNTLICPDHVDSPNASSYGWLSVNGTIYTTATPNRTYTSRPTNMAVLYCIKYE